MDKQLHKLAEKIVKYGKSNGADQVQVSIGSGREFSVDVLEGEIEQLSQAGSKSLSLKVIVDNKVATASSSDLSDETLHHLVKNAVKRAEYSSPDPFALLPDSEEIKSNIEKLNLYDPALEGVAPEKKIAAAKELEKICVGRKGVKMSVGSSFGTNIGEYILYNSNGFGSGYDYSSCYCGIGLQSGEGDHLFETGWWDSSRSFDKLWNIEDIADKAVHRVTRLIGAKKIATQKVPIVLEPPMTSSILGFLAGCVSGSAVYQKRTFLADKLGETIAAKNINIIDDGLIPGAPGSSPFDREGVPTRRTQVIKDGELRNFLLDTYSARKLGMKSTGNAGGTNNFYLEKGDHTPEEIIKSVDKGMLLVQTIGQGTVPTTGDISKGAFGIWIENGELSYPVAEVTISGNLGSLLKDIEMVGNDLEMRRSVAGPTIKIAEMTISGT